MMRQTTALASKLNGLRLVTRALLKRHSAEITMKQDGGTETSSPAAPGSGEPGIAIGDWNTLFNAVTARLRMTVSGDPVTPVGRQLAGNADSVKASVLECLAALDQLQRSMEHELARCQAIELQAFDAKTALVQALRRNARRLG